MSAVAAPNGGASLGAAPLGVPTPHTSGVELTQLEVKAQEQAEARSGVLQQAPAAQPYPATPAKAAAQSPMRA